MPFHVVIIDDEENLLAGLEMTLDELDENLEVKSFISAIKALDYLKNNQVDLIICDINMPQLDGINLIKQVKEDNSFAKVIFLTGYSDFTYAYEVNRLDATYLLKLEPEEIIKDTIKNELNKIKIERKAKLEALKEKAKLRKYERYYFDKIISLYINKKISLEEFKENLNLENDSSLMMFLFSLVNTSDTETIKIDATEIINQLIITYYHPTHVFTSVLDDNIIIVLTNKSKYFNDILYRLQSDIEVTYNLETIICYHKSPITIEEIITTFEFMKQKFDKIKFYSQSLMIEDLKVDNFTTDVQSTDLILRLEQLILEDIKNITLSSLAEKVNYNPSYLSRLYKKITNQNISDFIKKIRIDKAKELLKDNNLLIKDIANMVGFYSLSYFCAFFSKVVGVSPQAYRIMKTGKK